MRSNAGWWGSSGALSYPDWQDLSDHPFVDVEAPRLWGTATPGPCFSGLQSHGFLSLIRCPNCKNLTGHQHVVAA